MTLTAGPLRYILFGTICAGTFAVGVAGALFHEDHRITEGVYVEQVHVGGLSSAEATAKLERELLPAMPRQLELRSGASRWLVDNEKLGRRAKLKETVAQAYALGRDGGLLERARQRLRLAHQGLSLPLAVELDPARAEAVVTELAQRVDRPPVDARVSSVIGGQPYFAPEQDGLRVNVSATVAAMGAKRRFPPPAAIPLVVEQVPPKVRAAALQGDLNTVIATFRTNMADGYHGVMRENRAHNVRLLIERMKGRVLLPGEEWSFNNDLGERRVEDGFKSSIVFMRKPDGTIEERWSTGGGICQLATTIFNAALYANLAITQRGNHSKTVHYARIGRDATVYYGVVDLKFRNTLPHAVLLWGELLSNYDLVITVIGHRDDDTEVDLTSDSWAGRTGQGGSLWRTVRSADGRVLKDREHICDSFYPYEAKVTSAAD